MKRNLLLTIVLFVMISFTAFSQSWYLNQVIVGSGGNFSDPDDYVTIAAYNPRTNVTTTFDTIYTQSIQDIIVENGHAWVAAQDSIVKYDLDLYTRVAAIGAVGVNKLKITGNTLIATFQFPATSGFVKTFSASDLSEVFVFNDVSDESAGMHIMSEESQAVIAVPGGWMSTVGKMAWLDIEDNTVVGEIDFQTDGVGINYFVSFEIPVPTNAAVTVTPWGDSTFNLLMFSAAGFNLGSYKFSGTMAGYTGQLGNTLFAKINGGIGALDMSEMELDPNLLIEPGTLSIAGTCIDTISGNFYIASTDYFSTGEGVIYDVLGLETGSFDAGISPDAIAIDYRDNTFISITRKIDFKIFPNPASSSLTINTNGVSGFNYKIVDMSGRIVKEGISNFGIKTIDVSSVEQGMYLFTVFGETSTTSTSFIKL